MEKSPSSLEAIHFLLFATFRALKDPEVMPRDAGTNADVVLDAAVKGCWKKTKKKKRDK